MAFVKSIHYNYVVSTWPSIVPRNNDVCMHIIIINNDIDIMSIHLILFVVFVVATISFSQSLYSVAENSGVVEIFMVLSNPSPTDITVQVLNTEGSATGKNILLFL